jgi:hypothetical protein
MSIDARSTDAGSDCGSEEISSQGSSKLPMRSPAKEMLAGTPSSGANLMTGLIFRLAIHSAAMLLEAPHVAVQFAPRCSAPRAYPVT